MTDTTSEAGTTPAAVIDVDEVPADAAGAELEVAPAAAARRHSHGADERTAIEAAADAALMMPGVPGREEFLSLAVTARILSMSAAAPPAVRNNPHLAFHLALIGRDLGISPSASLELIDVIERKRGSGEYQLSLSPQLLSGQLRRLGLGAIIPVERTELRALVVAVGPRGIDPRCAVNFPEHADDCRCDLLGPSEFTWEDARIAQLVGPDCMPGDHKMVTKNKRGGGTYQTCGCNQGYVTYPKRMLHWRASGFAADDYFPEASLGLYSPEALGAVVDEDGRAIDPGQVELPEGYEGKTATPTSTSEDLASEEDRAAIRARIDRLPPEALPVLTEAWQKPNPQDNVPNLWPLKRLPNRQIKSAHALIDMVEGRARKGEWGEWTPAPDVPAEAAPEGQDAPEEDPAAEGPAERESATEPPGGPALCSSCQTAPAVDPVTGLCAGCEPF
jgi:hypothetical protein